jgi:Zinc carboxypeptidase
MNVPFLTASTQSSFLLALLACATPATSAKAVAASAAQESQGFEPLVIGDPPASDLQPFFQGAEYDESVLTPDAVLGRPLGTRMASHAEVLTLWRAWAEHSPRVRLETYGRTHEGRELVVGIVTSPAARERLEGIQSAIQRLADPRGLSPAEEDALVAETPAIAWMGYSIHGDETSGVDGGLAFAYHLIAGKGADVERLLEKVVVVIDPCMNPDGRERVRSMMLQSAGAVPSLDADSLSRGRWPWGRGNHYLFDMNRDWMTGVAPETRGRWSVLRRYPPQLFVDAHEMGGLDTYLFYPQSAPHNPELPESLSRWHKVFADAQGAAFDQRGWSYYTREWADAWAPFYSDAWGSLNGAVGMLYEQAGYGGQPLRRPSGEIVTYREAAWHQAVASLASLSTLAAHRQEVLRDFVAFRRANLAVDAPGRKRAFVLLPGRNPARERWLVDTLRAQGVELEQRTQPATARNARSALGVQREELELPAGAIVVPPSQPKSSLVRAYLAFDPRIDDAALLEERKELEQKGRSGMYDVTSWCLAQALDLDAWWCDPPDADGGQTPLEALDAAPTGVAAPTDAGAPVYGWIVDGADDTAVAFAARALELGLALQFADESFESAGRSFARGSLLVRRHENGADVGQRVESAAQQSGALAVPTGGARAPGEGPDLGGQHFHLLARPRVALLAGGPVSSSDFGHLWHLLDRELGVPVSLLETTSLSSYDLRRYNVLVLPPAGGSLRALLSPLKDDLQAWVRSGGTLIAIDSAAGALADADLGLSAVRDLASVLNEREAYHAEAQREWAARKITVVPAAVWEGTTSAEGAPKPSESKESGERPPKGSADERDDRWKRRFMPHGATLLGLCDPEQWITVGCSERMPVLADGDQVLMSRAPTRTAVRLAPAAELRLAGLLWPEARERLAESAWLTVERVGHGQVILFAAHPLLRGYHKATGRLFANAVIYGPGLGSDQPLGW